ncbi:MAG: hypothetical protein FJ116_01780 [Deltaproteobacteria bacterium]|nr:hypothetical protein [Deltaproteobacteria bacterium]
MKNKLFIKTALLVLFCACCAAPKSQASPLSLANFKLGYAKTSPKTIDSSSSIDLGWTPKLDLLLFVLRGEIGAFAAKRSANSSFLISNYEVLGGIRLLPGLIFEAGGGLQNWHGAGGVFPVATGGVVLNLGTALDRLYFNYCYAFNKNNETKILKLGIGLNL